MIHALVSIRGVTTTFTIRNGDWHDRLRDSDRRYILQMSSLVIETPANISVIKDRFGLFPNPQEVQTMGQVIAQIEELLDPANPAHTLKEATSGKAQED